MRDKGNDWMSKIIKLLKADEIKIAFGLGFCIILLAFVSKRILHIEMRGLYSAIPGLIAILWEVLRRGKKLDRKYTRPLYWNLAMIASAAIILLLHIER